ncbi:MAG: metal transporter permease [Bacillales bacterium]|nr:metal transporter permease [Bacillales bacterium]
MIYDILQYDFLQFAFLTGLMIGIIAPLLGVFIVVRRLSLIADALSHVTLSGIALSLLLSKNIGSLANLNPLYIGMGFSVVGSLFIERLRAVYKHYQELAIPIILSAGIGLGVIFISLAKGFTTDLFNYLFGSVSAVSQQDLLIIAIITVIVIGTVYLLYKELFLLSFDEEHAKTSGLKVNAVHFTFIILVALVIAASMRVVGILLVSSLMTLPVAAAMKIAKSFKKLIFISIMFAEIAVVGGLIISYYLDLAPGGSIVVLSILLLLTTIICRKIQAKTAWKGEDAS